MANIAENIIMVTFKEHTLEEKQKVLDYFIEHLMYENYNDAFVDDSNYIELCYGTKWSENQEILQDICNKFDVDIIGVCYEWGCGYVNSFELCKD